MRVPRTLADDKGQLISADKSNSGLRDYDHCDGALIRAVGDVARLSPPRRAPPRQATVPFLRKGERHASFERTASAVGGRRSLELREPAARRRAARSEQLPILSRVVH